MKLVSKLLLAAMCAAAAVVPAMAQEKKSTFSVFGNYTKAQGASDGSGSVGFGYGHMVSPQIELGLTDFVSFSSNSTMNMLGLNAKYYLSNPGKVGSLTPYVKAGVTTTLMNQDTTEYRTITTPPYVITSTVNKTTTSSGYSGYVGAEYSLTESAAFYVEGGSNSSNGSSTTVVFAGITVRF